jgi:copper resistance protein C
MKTFFYRASLWVGLLLALPAIASAHAFVDHAEPKVGSEGPPPTEVRIWFTQQPEAAFSRIQVFDASGAEVDKNDTHADAGDKKMLIVSLGPLAAGKYKVVWKVLSVDTHRTNGDFKFTVR